MQEGKKTVDKLTVAQMKDLLSNIIEDCIDYAGDSYADFGEAIVKRLHQMKLVDYGTSKEKAIIEKYGFQYIDCSLEDDNIKLLFKACDYDIDVIRDWEKSIENYFNGRSVSTDEFLNAYNNGTLKEYAERFSENYHKETETIERE